MKAIHELRNPDIIMINNENYQVIRITSLWYDDEKKELTMVVELVRENVGNITPSHRLTYVDDKPDSIKFFNYNKEKDEFVEEKLESFDFH